MQQYLPLMVRGAARPIAAAGSAALLLSALAGCMSSAGRASFSAHTTHEISPGGEATAEMRTAFRLDEGAPPPDAMVSVDTP